MPSCLAGRQAADDVVAYTSFVTSRNTGTIVSPSPETFVRTAVYCFHWPLLTYGTT